MSLVFPFDPNIERASTIPARVYNDPVFLEAGAHAYRRDVPDAEVHLLDTGHFPLQEDTEATASLMLDFLDRRIGGAS